MSKHFTGRHMSLILCAGFGVVMAVNFGMAALASRSFSGVVVENSYVASQDFNEWLEAAEKQERLGWNAQVRRDEAGHLLVETSGVPNGAKVRAEIRRPLGDHDSGVIELFQSDEGLFRSAEALPAGRWTVRLLIESSRRRYAIEEPLV